MVGEHKHTAVKIIGQLPDDVSMENIIYELYVHQRIEEGLREEKEGHTVSHEEVMRDVAQWLQFAGQAKPN